MACQTVKDGLAAAGSPSGLEPLISHTMCLDNRLRERRRDQGSHQNYPDTPGQSWSPMSLPLENPEPMQIGRHRITAAERALVDSGAAGNFIDINLAHRLKVPLDTLHSPLSNSS